MITTGISEVSPGTHDCPFAHKDNRKVVISIDKGKHPEISEDRMTKLRDVVNYYIKFGGRTNKRSKEPWESLGNFASRIEINGKKVSVAEMLQVSEIWREIKKIPPFQH